MSEVINLKRASIATGLSFIINGLAVGSLYSRVPDFKRNLNISTGTLGSALFFAAFGVVTALIFAGKFAAKYGSAPMTLLGGAAIVLTYPFLGLAPSLPWLCLTLFLYGFTASWQDLAMNAHALAIERRSSMRVLSRFHAMWSVGAVLGGALGGIFAQHHITIFKHFLTIAIVIALIHIYIRIGLLPASADKHDFEGKKRVKRPRIFWYLGAIGFCAALSEGSAGDWGGVLLRDTFGATPFVSTIPYIFFALMMVVGRLSGDHIAHKFGIRNSVTAFGALAGIGLIAGLIIGGPVGISLGWFCLGLGISIVLPLMFSTAGEIAEQSYSTSIAPSQAIAMVSGISYFGFLVGPPFIGVVAELISLRTAMLIPAALVLALAFAVRKVISGKDSASGE